MSADTDANGFQSKKDGLIAGDYEAGVYPFLHTPKASPSPSHEQQQQQQQEFFIGSFNVADISCMNKLAISHSRKKEEGLLRAIALNEECLVKMSWSMEIGIL